MVAIAILSTIESAVLAQEGIKGGSKKARSPILSPTRTCSDSVSPTHTLIHSSPELPPLPSFTYLQDYPRTPKASSAPRRIGTNQYYTASWGSPYSQSPSGSQDQVNLAGYDESFGSGCLDSESPDIRFSLTHLLPSRNLRFTSSSWTSDIAARSIPRSFDDGASNRCNIETAFRSGQDSSDNLTSLPILRNQKPEPESSWASFKIEKRQSYPPRTCSLRTGESPTETNFTSSGSSTPVKKQSRKKEEQRWSGYRPGHKSRKENLTLKPENFTRLTAGGTGDMLGTMLHSKYADPAFEANKEGANESHEKIDNMALNDSSEISQGLELRLRQSAGPAMDSPPRKTSSSVEDRSGASLKRVRKRITSRRGKTCIIHLPLLMYKKTLPKVPPSSLEESHIIEKPRSIVEVPRDCDVYSQNCEIFPDPKEDEHARSEKRYPVHIPNHREWEEYVRELQEQKLRALGVSIDDEKTATSMSRQGSSQNPNSTCTPPLLAHFAGVQPSWSSISHAVSPSLTSSSPNPFASGSATSPLPNFGKPILSAQSQRTVSPAFGYQGPFRQPTSSPAWFPQPHVNYNGTPYNTLSMAATDAMSTVDKFSVALPHEASELSNPKMNEFMLPQRQKSQQQYNAFTRPRSTLERVPESTKEDAISPKTVAARPVEIVVPVPRGHRHNISASLEEDIKDAEYHLEKAIDRQFGENGEFDSEPAHSQTASSIRDTGEFRHNYERSKPQQSSARGSFDAQHGHLSATGQLLKDTRSLGDIPIELLHSKSMDRNLTDGKKSMSTNLNECQSKETALAPEERYFAGQLAYGLKNNHTIADKTDKSEKLESNSSKASTRAKLTKPLFSNLNAGAQEFSLYDKPSSSASPLSVSDFTLNQGPIKPTSSSKQSARAHISNAAFNVTAPSFTPLSSGFGLKIPTQKFNFTSGGPLFKPEAPEFVPQSIPSYTSLTSTETKVSSNSHTISQRVFPFFNYEIKNTARKSKKATNLKSDNMHQSWPDHEDENGRITRAIDEQKRARRDVKDRDEVPRFALHPQPSSGTARAYLDKSYKAHDIHLSESKENEAPHNTTNNGTVPSTARDIELLTSSTSVGNVPNLSNENVEDSLTKNCNRKSKTLDMQSSDNIGYRSLTSTSNETFVQTLEKENQESGMKVALVPLNTEVNGALSSAKNNDTSSDAENPTQQAQSHDNTQSFCEGNTTSNINTSNDHPLASQTDENITVAQYSHGAGKALVSDPGIKHTDVREDLGLQDSNVDANHNEQSVMFECNSPGKSNQSLNNFQQLTHNHNLNPQQSLSQIPNLQGRRPDDISKSSCENEELSRRDTLEQETKNSMITGSSNSDTFVKPEDFADERDVTDNMNGDTVDDLRNIRKSTSDYRPNRAQKALHKVEANHASRMSLLDPKGSELDSDADDEDDEPFTSHDYRKRWPIPDHRSESIKTVIAETVASQRDILGEVRELKTEVKSLGLPGQMSGSRYSRSATEDQDGFEANSLDTAVNSILLSVAELKSERDLNIQVSELKEQLKEALMRANCAESAKNEAQHKLSETQQWLEASRAESAHRVSLDDRAHTRITQDENLSESCSRSSHFTTGEHEDDNMHSEVRRLNAEVEALSSTLEEYRVSSTKWRSEIDESHQKNEILKGTISNVKLQLEEALRMRDSMQSKLETLQENLMKAVSQAANDKAHWQHMDQETRNKYDLLSVKHDAVLKMNAKLEKAVERLEGEEKEAIKIRVVYDQSQKANSSLSETINQLRTDNIKLEALTAHSESVLKEAKENSHAEAQRMKIILNAETEIAKKEADNVRLDMRTKVSALQTQLHEVTEEYNSAKARYEQQFQKQIDSEMLAIKDALKTKDAALRDNSLVHEENVANLKSHHEDVLNQAMMEKQQSEAHLNNRLDLAQREVNHLRDKVAYLAEKLQVSESAAHAAALAAQSAKTPFADQQSEKVSPKALRETIQALQEQLQEREQRIEHLEGQVSSFDTEAPSKLKEREAEVSWLRELFSVRIDDLGDLVSTLSHSDYDREVVRDAAIRLKASLQMEQQERERLTAGDRPFPSFPNVATISNFASPKAAQLAAAIGNWRKGKETARLFQRPPSASSSESTTPAKLSAQPHGLLSGLMTPPASNLRRTPDTQSSTPRRKAAGRLSNATDLPVLEPKLREKHSAPITPPLLGQCGYDDDAESGQFSISRFQEDDTASIIGSRYEEY